MAMSRSMPSILARIPGDSRQNVLLFLKALFYGIFMELLEAALKLTRAIIGDVDARL